MVRESPKEQLNVFVDSIHKKTFCGGINEEVVRKSKKIIKYIC